MAIFPTEITDAANLQGSYRILGDDGTEAVDFSITQLEAYMQANLAFATSIAGVSGLQAALDGKSDIGHTHVISDVSGLQDALDGKLDDGDVNLVGNTLYVKGNLINIDSGGGSGTGGSLPTTSNVDDFLQFTNTVGDVKAVGRDEFRSELGIDQVANLNPIDYPVSTIQQTALDGKVDNSRVLTDVPSDAVFTDTPTNISSTLFSSSVLIGSSTGSGVVISAASPSAAGVMSVSNFNKLESIEAGANETTTQDVWDALGISTEGSTSQFLTQRGVFVDAPTGSGDGGGGSGSSVSINTDGDTIVIDGVATDIPVIKGGSGSGTTLTLTTNNAPPISIPNVLGVQNLNQSSNEPAVWKFWSGTETEFQALVSADQIDDTVFYHRREG